MCVMWNIESDLCQKNPTKQKHQTKEKKELRKKTEEAKEKRIKKKLKNLQANYYVDLQIHITVLNKTMYRAEAHLRLV